MSRGSEHDTIAATALALVARAFNRNHDKPLMTQEERPSNTVDLLTPAQAAELKGVSRTAVYSAIAEDRLPHVRMLGRLAVKRSDLEAWKPVRYAGRPRGFTVSTEVRAKMSQASKRLWAKRKRERKIQEQQAQEQKKQN